MRRLTSFRWNRVDGARRRLLNERALLLAAGVEEDTTTARAMLDAADLLADILEWDARES